MKWKKNSLEKYGFTAEEIKDILDKVIALDAKLAKYVLSTKNLQSMWNSTTHMIGQTFTKLAPELPLDSIFTEILGQVPDKVIVPEERFWTEFAAEYYSEANWELLKAVLLIDATTSWNAYLTDELRVLSGKYGRALSGTPQACGQEKSSLLLGTRTLQSGSWTLVCR